MARSREQSIFLLHLRWSTSAIAKLSRSPKLLHPTRRYPGTTVAEVENLSNQSQSGCLHGEDRHFANFEKSTVTAVESPKLYRKEQRVQWPAGNTRTLRRQRGEDDDLFGAWVSTYTPTGERTANPIRQGSRTRYCQQHRTQAQINTGRVSADGRNNFSPRETTIKRFQIIDNLSFLLGRNSFKTGVDVNRDRIFNFFPGFSLVSLPLTRSPA